MLTHRARLHLHSQRVFCALERLDQNVATRTLNNARPQVIRRLGQRVLLRRDRRVVAADQIGTTPLYNYPNLKSQNLGHIRILASISFVQKETTSRFTRQLISRSLSSCSLRSGREVSQVRLLPGVNASLTIYII